MMFRTPPTPNALYWLPLEHTCGCIIDWGCDDRLREQLPRFLASAVHFPCPVHGSASGVPNAPLAPGERRYLAQADIFYRLADSALAADARRNRAAALQQGPCRGSN
jgi:hypothetical protein